MVAVALAACAGFACRASAADNLWNSTGPSTDFVRLRYAIFDPTVGTPAVPARLRAGAENELYLVQFRGTPLESMREQIRAMGGTVERFLTDNTHVVRMTPEVRGLVAKLGYVRWVGAYEPAYRMSEDVRAWVLSNDGVARRYSIETMRVGPGQQQTIADLVAKMGGKVNIVTPDQYRMEVTVTPEQILEIARRNEVNFIDPWYGPGGPDMDLIRQTFGAVPTASNAGFLGQGVRGELFDGGLVPNHQQWNGQAPLIHSPGTTTDSHGTACFGICFATGNGNTLATGMLPMREQGIFVDYNDCTQFGGPTSRLTFNTQATDPNGPYRSCFQTSSIGSPQITTYSTISAEVDDYLWRVDYLSCQSQSNTGSRTSRPQAWAKNIVSVGGLQLNETISLADDLWETGSSYGPAQDLRVKPDLSNSWSNIFTTYSSSPTGYGQFGGTSGATPITAGHMGLLMQMWHEGVWSGFGGGSSVFADRPKSTTAKAIAINSCYQYPTTQGNGMYRARIGWGAIHVGNAYTMRDKTFIVNATDLLTQGQTSTYHLNVVAGEPFFKATMVFADPMGNPAAAQARINDLSLRVTDPNGVQYWGNNGMIATSVTSTAGANTTTPGGAANTIDTVENVFVQNPAAGSWTVEVIASQIVQDAHPGTTALDADYSLVVSGVTLTAPCYANCDGSTTTPVLNVNDFVCFQNRFAAGDSYANCDGSTQPPVLNVNDFVCYQNLFAAGCP